MSGKYVFIGGGSDAFTQIGFGSVTRTLQEKNQDTVSDADFGLTGSGDEFVALTNFFNSAISRPGVVHTMRALTYSTSGQLPTINVSNVLVHGAGTEIHDVGPLMTGTIIKWIGAANGIIQIISSVAGASNAKIANIELLGIGYDCNSGTADYGLRIYSIRDSDIDTAIANAGQYGMSMNVVASLGEATDIQGCRIKLRGRQVEAAAGGCLLVGGDASGNVSMNHFWCDLQHKDGPAIVETNADNNDWWFIRTSKVGGGAATEAISWLGAASEPISCREERIHFLTGNLTSHSYGTGTYTVGANRIRIFCLDTGNSTPAPTVDTGSTVYWNRASTPFGDTPWVAYTPTITANAGTFTTVSATGRYLQRGLIVHVHITITITTNGTAATAILATLPITTTANAGGMFIGKETALTGNAITGIVTPSSTSLAIQTYNGGYPGANGAVITIDGRYEIA